MNDSVLRKSGGVIQSVRAVFQIFAALVAIASTASAARAEQPTPDGVRDWYKRVARVQTVARRILAANLETCPIKRDDFGFTSVSPDPAASAAVRAAWIEGLGLGDGLTVVAVFPGGPAEAAGIKVGDRIVEINGARWSSNPEDRKAFASAMAGVSSLHLAVKRGADEVKMVVPAQQICTANVWLTPRAKINAFSNGVNIVVEGGMEQLLPSDDELAWVIAHEAAHAFLGHTGADRAADVKNNAIRSQMERQADALSLRLMLRAGFSPEASFSAQPKIAAASRGPISRLLDLHGPYMGTRERTAYLIAEVSAARSELGRPSAPR